MMKAVGKLKAPKFNFNPRIAMTVMMANDPILKHH